VVLVWVFFTEKMTTNEIRKTADGFTAFADINGISKEDPRTYWVFTSRAYGKTKPWARHVLAGLLVRAVAELLAELSPDDRLRAFEAHCRECGDTLDRGVCRACDAGEEGLAIRNAEG
jgi:hypothetical protein